VTAPGGHTGAVAGRPAAWLEAGSKPPLLLFHGAGGAADREQPQLDGLADVARVVAPNLPGHGPLDGRGEPSITAYAEWLPVNDAIRDFLSRVPNTGGKMVPAR
jgi:pimeloyl-ACP methyl ester carboxylesterase